jgi:hypothetical protein
MFIGMNLKCAHHVRPPLGRFGGSAGLELELDLVDSGAERGDSIEALTPL